jgi:hypothetical protein
VVVGAVEVGVEEEGAEAEEMARTVRVHRPASLREQLRRLAKSRNSNCRSRPAERPRRPEEG